MGGRATWAAQQNKTAPAKKRANAGFHCVLLPQAVMVELRPAELSAWLL